MSLGPDVSTYDVTDLDVVKYGAKDFTLAGGLQTGSPSINVKYYSNVTFFGAIGTQQDGSGSLVISGSFDKVTWHKIQTGSVFNSGSNAKITLTDAIPYISGHLLSATTGSAITGSLYVCVGV
jgi:hypothetical protein